MSVENGAAKSGRKDISCILQYLIDKIPYIAEDASIEKHGILDMSMNVDAVSLYTGDDDQPKSGNVYLCRPEHLSRLSDAYRTAVLFCVNNGPHIESVPECFNVIIVNCSQSLEYVFNVLQRTITNLRMSDILLDRAVLEEMEIQDIIDIAEHTISNPFLLLDADFQLLGWSKSKECPDPIYTQTIFSGSLPYKYIMRLVSQDALKKLYSCGTVVFSKSHKISDSTIVMVMVKNDELIIGCGILICSRREPKQPMIQGFEGIVGKFKSKLYERIDVSYSQANKEVYFYIMLLNGTISDEAEMQRYSTQLELPARSEYLLHVIQCGGSLPARYAFRYFSEDVSGENLAFVYGKSIVLIEKYNASQPALSDSQGYKKFLKDYKARAGISSRFYKLLDLRNAFVQADLSLKIGKKLSRSPEPLFFDHSSGVFRYSDYVQYLLIEHMYNEVTHFPFTCIRLLELLADDKEQKTDFARTLFIYLKNNGHVTETAQEMFFHRNSILNRIKQISEFMDMDLSDYKTRAELLFNFKVLDYAKAVGKMDQLMKLIE